MEVSYGSWILVSCGAWVNKEGGSEDTKACVLYTVIKAGSGEGVERGEKEIGKKWRVVWGVEERVESRE